MPALSRLAIVVCFAFSATALAQPNPAPKAPSVEAQRQAKAHFKQGKAFLDAALYDDAIRELETGYGLTPIPQFLFNIAQAYRLKGDNDKALDTYLRFLDAEPDGPVSDEARVHVAYLTKDREARQETERKRLEEEERRRKEEDARRAAEAVAAAERARQEAERQRREAEETRRQQEEAARHAEEQRRMAELRRQQEAEAAARAAYDKERALRTHRRRIGYAFAGIGVGSLAIATTFAILGSGQNSAVQAGGFTTASDIHDTISTGTIYNGVAWTFGAIGLAGVALGAPYIALDLDRGAFKVTPIATGDVKGLVLSGTLP